MPDTQREIANSFAVVTGGPPKRDRAGRSSGRADGQSFVRERRIRAE